MSYEVAIFDASAAPKVDDDEFLEWYAAQVAPDADPDVGTVAMRLWFSDFSDDFPALNGPYADGKDGTTTYAFGPTVTRAICPDGQAKKAAEDARALAAKNGVGFFNPNPGDLRLAFP